MRPLHSCPLTVPADPLPFLPPLYHPSTPSLSIQLFLSICIFSFSLLLAFPLASSFLSLYHVLCSSSFPFTLSIVRQLIVKDKADLSTANTKSSPHSLLLLHFFPILLYPSPIPSTLPSPSFYSPLVPTNSPLFPLFLSYLLFPTLYPVFSSLPPPLIVTFPPTPLSPVSSIPFHVPIPCLFIYPNPPIRCHNHISLRPLDQLPPFTSPSSDLHPLLSPNFILFPILSLTIPTCPSTFPS